MNGKNKLKEHTEIQLVRFVSHIALCQSSLMCAYTVIHYRLTKTYVRDETYQVSVCSFSLFLTFIRRFLHFYVR